MQFLQEGVFGSISKEGLCRRVDSADQRVVGERWDRIDALYPSDYWASFLFSKPWIDHQTRRFAAKILLFWSDIREKDLIDLTAAFAREIGTCATWSHAVYPADWYIESMQRVFLEGPPVAFDHADVQEAWLELWYALAGLPSPSRTSDSPVRT